MHQAERLHKRRLLAAGIVVLLWVLLPVTPAAGQGGAGGGSACKGSARNALAIGGPRGGGPLPIARWNVVPHQSFAGDFPVGVVTFHRDGISRVIFWASGVALGVATEMTLNPRTGTWEYVLPLDATAFPDGPIEVHAMVIPEAGPPRTLEPLLLSADSGGSLPSAARFVSPTGSDTSGDGSEQNPFATILRAARSIQDGAASGTADGGVIHLLAGDHNYGSYSYPLLTITETRWLTIRPAPGLTRDDVAITSSTSSGLKTRLVRIEDVTIRSPLATSTPLEDHLSLEGCLLLGNGATTNVGSSGFVNRASWSSFYAVGCTVRENRDGLLGAALQRNVRVEEIGSDAFSDTLLVVGCSVDGIDSSGTQYHPDVYQFSGTGVSRENVIIYGLEALDATAQGIFADDLAALGNVAIVNVLIEATPNYLSQWKDVATDHLLLWGVTIAGQTFAWRTPELDSVSVVGSVFERMTWEAPFDISGFRHNHYSDTVTPGSIAPGLDATTGDPGFVDPILGDYHPEPGSPLLDRVLSPPVPVDLENTPRESPTSCGAFH